MEITRDLFPTDARVPYLTLSLASRDLASHNLLTSLTPAEREQIGAALSAAGAAIVRVLRAVDGPQHASGSDRSNSGRGT